MCVKEREEKNSILMLQLVMVLCDFCSYQCAKDRYIALYCEPLGGFFMLYFLIFILISFFVSCLISGSVALCFKVKKNNGHSTVANIHYASHCVSLHPSFSSKFALSSTRASLSFFIFFFFLFFLFFLFSLFILSPPFFLLALLAFYSSPSSCSRQEESACEITHNLTLNII